MSYVERVYRLREMSHADLLSFANLARGLGYHGVADAAIGEMHRRTGAP